MPALSVSEAVGDAVEAAVTALALTGAPTVVKRKTPGLPEGAAGTTTQISVSVLEDTGEPLDARRRLQSYTLVVAIVRPGGSKAGDSDQAVRDWRQRIIRKLDDLDRTVFTGLPSGSEINRCDFTGGRVPFDPAAAPKDYDFSALVFRVEVIETRATS